MTSADGPALAPLTFTPLPLGQVRPRGWLERQLRIQADGLSGHLDEFWPDVANSGWIGGDAEGWERGPYWLDGMVPLAFLLRDERLLAKVRHWVDYILEHQHEDGWLGPAHDHTYGYAYDPWPPCVALKALTQYADATGDERVEQAMVRFFRRLSDAIAERELMMWIQVRWADLVLSIQWLYERCPERWLLDLAARLHEQGFDWRALFEAFPFTGKTDFEASAANGTYLQTHGVNNAMGVRQPGIWSRHSADAADRTAGTTILAALDRYHGQANGAFTCDEHLAGLHPSQGTELCTVVELMFSLEVLLAIQGDPALGDRLEQLAFNALPATLSPDMWSHQYDQQANQVQCAVVEDRVYTDNAADANIFGLAPNFGCCTANLHQGWPKFTTHLWMRSQDGGLAATAYAPCAVETEMQGVSVRVTVDTDYPFDDAIRLMVEPAAPATFPLHLRIPDWADGALLRVGDGEPEPVTPASFHRVARAWTGSTPVELRLPMRVRCLERPRGAVTMARGPLVYALEIGEEWRHLKGDLPHADYEVHPTTPWNYALRIDPQALDSAVSFSWEAVGDCPFSPGGAPVRARVHARRLPEWKMERGAAAAPPSSPVRSDAPEELVTLIPYGCTNLRISEFPRLAP